MEEVYARITALAALMTGAEPEEVRPVVEATAAEAMARCRREDIPAGMEAVVARIAAEIFAGADAESITEGDISVSYGTRTPWERANSALYAFRRLV